MASKPNTDPHSRLSLLRRLLTQGEISTQEDLVEELKRQKFNVTQSTISRDLRRLGAVKAIDPSGQTTYRLSEDFRERAPVATTGLRGLLLDISHNNSMIVIHTTPGSASLLARHLDQTKPAGILGTIAGDDTIFVAPSSSRNIGDTVKIILEEMT